MAIQNRRGAYVDFDPTKMVAGEFAVVQSGDENTADGKALYVAPTTGEVKRIPFADELEDLVEVDDTLTEAGAAADAKKTGDEITALKDDLTQKGLSENIKTAILDCFSHVAWTDEQGQTYYDALYDALYPQTSLVSISATFDSGQNSIYSDMELDDLKAYLTVTGYYNDGTVRVIRDYSLSGTISVGTDTINVASGGKTTSFEVTVLDALDRIVYDNLSYRDIFVTGNICSIGDFEGDITLSNTETVLANGDRYRINAGTPIISNEDAASGNRSLKCFGTSSYQIQYKSSRLPATGHLFCGCCVNCNRYVRGYAGIQPNIYNGANQIATDAISIEGVTDGYSKIAKILEYSGTENNVKIDNFIGTYTSANSDVYIDNVVFSVVPDTMTLEKALQLYENYINILNKEV